MHGESFAFMCMIVYNDHKSICFSSHYTMKLPLCTVFLGLLQAVMHRKQVDSEYSTGVDRQIIRC